ncbi:hypothetical protein CAPTEDRAFT_206233 [Capitella teleta]|uniref:Uncharacterized protein n=1 Tax=Capitella teleta TaxID=283909 RepID=R7T4V7_CAPTE|nr:hypothetical protein CAPTEDRAFT_206233 [Capitella teleta]|eukprot:ELT87946.1 hypothetical protein CAPTEDRAFT_206233 [Capitella teleta]
MTGEREKRAVARSKNRRQKSVQTQLPNRTLLEYARERQAVEKKVLEEERKELEEEKMKIEEGMSSSAINALPRRLNPNRFSTMTEGKVDDLVENFKEVLNKENYEELHLPFIENVRPPLEKALVKIRELFFLERSSSLRSHTLAPKAFLASLEAMLPTVQKQ